MCTSTSAAVAWPARPMPSSTASPARCARSTASSARRSRKPDSSRVTRAPRSARSTVSRAHANGSSSPSANRDMKPEVPVEVVGASGYTGAELLRLLAVHPHVRIAGVYAKRAAGERLPAIFPQFAGRLDLEIRSFDAAEIAAAARVAFCALPHGESSPIVAQLYERGLTVLDLSADLRLHDPAAYKEWYGHEASPLCQEAVYGIPELARRDLRDVRLWAVPGCYPTASLLALAPLVDAGL